MSTQCVINFRKGPEVAATIWLSNDGIPERVGTDIHCFLEYLNENIDNKCIGGAHFSDPGALICKYIIYKVDQNHQMRKQSGENPNYLDFYGIAITDSGYDEWEYIYDIDCDVFDEKGLPTVTCYHNGRLTEIPTPE